MTLARLLHNCTRRGRILVAVALLPTLLHADEEKWRNWRVWLEPSFMRAPVAEPFAGAKRTEVAAGTLTDSELNPFTKEEFGKLGWSWDSFSTLAQYQAATDLRHLRYSFVRDRRGIITYARVDSDRPVVSSVVLIPGFLDLWQSTLGEKVLMVVPNRFTAFLFPRLASDYLEYWPMVFRAYRETAYPVSVEVFELSADGWRCLGAYEEP